MTEEKFPFLEMFPDADVYADSCGGLDKAEVYAGLSDGQLPQEQGQQGHRPRGTQDPGHSALSLLRVFPSCIQAPARKICRRPGSGGYGKRHKCGVFAHFSSSREGGKG